jgi:hypothetical protein
MEWKRYRFKTRSIGDHRPLVFNPQCPWWCTGKSEAGGYASIVAYLPSNENLLNYWDDAFDIEFSNESGITFSERFPMPDYFKRKPSIVI